MPDRLDRQLGFLLELDRLKSICRRSYLLDESRLENSAEHSWHVALATMVLAEHAAEPLDVARVVAMLLLHDVVEIDAGDTYAYDALAAATQPEREQLAAERIFGLLPADQGPTLTALRDEFEARETPEARFAHCVDRLLPFLHNYHTAGRAWREHGVHVGQVQQRMAPLRESAPPLAAHMANLVAEAARQGWLVGDEPCAPAPPAAPSDRLWRQLDFVLEADRLKRVNRRTTLQDGSRHENAAEHSWHLALAALVLAEHAAGPLRLDRVVAMLLVHDLVEIDAGDTYCYDDDATARQSTLEAAAAARLYGLLPDDQAATLFALWREFEAQTTPEARFAGATDRALPWLQYYHLGTHTPWQEWGDRAIGAAQVRARLAALPEVAPRLAEHVATLIAEAARQGWLKPEPS